MMFWLCDWSVGVLGMGGYGGGVFWLGGLEVVEWGGGGGKGMGWYLGMV